MTKEHRKCIEVGILLILIHRMAQYSLTILRSQSPQVLQPCFSTLAQYAPDPFDIGTSLFFAAVSSGIIGELDNCLSYLNRCLESAWVGVDRNVILCHFARGKALQRSKRHQEAIADFNHVISMQSNHAHAIFRRAWSYKV